MNRNKTKLTALAIIILVTPIQSNAQTTTSSTQINLIATTTSVNLSTTTPSTGLLTTPKLVTQIEAAKRLLENETSNLQVKKITKTVKKKKQTSYILGTKDFYAAVLDEGTDQITIAKGTQNGNKITFPGQNISQIGFNGVNTRLEAGQGRKVLAIKYLITPVESSGNASSIKNSAYEAIYTPWNPKFVSDEVSAFGANYLENVLTQAVNEISTLPSKSIPGQTITNAVKPQLVKSLIYAEHLDTAGNDLESTKQQIAKVNTLFATNEQDTYNYSGSSAGAFGLAQFIEPTYKSLVSRNPEANLIPNFKQGMQDHKNAIKAMYLLLDDYIAAVRVASGDNFIPGHAFDYGAASYNGGVVRIARAAKQYGPQWFETTVPNFGGIDQDIMASQKELATQTANLKKATKQEKSQIQAQINTLKSKIESLKKERTTIENSTLRAETIGYIKKMHRVIQILNI